jgi:hypothetical protein
MVKLSSHDFIVLAFSGKKLDPDKITKITGIEPDTRAKKGSFSIASEFLSRCYPKYPKKSKNGYWTVGMSQRKGIEAQFSEITKKFKKCHDSLIEIMSWDSIEQAYIEIVVKPSAKDGIYSCRLRAKDLEFWSSIGIDVVYSCWVPSWDKDIEE